MLSKLPYLSETKMFFFVYISLFIVRAPSINIVSDEVKLLKKNYKKIVFSKIL